MTATVLAITPDPMAPPDIVETQLTAQGMRVEIVHPREVERARVLTESADGLLIMGGVESVIDPKHADMFARLDNMVHEFHNSSRPVLGVCLGGQVVAAAFGGVVSRVGELQFGYLNVQLRDEASDDTLLASMPRENRIFCWHEDCFTLPDNALWLAESERVPAYGFRLGMYTYGFQCHFEFSPPTLDRLIARGAHLVPKNLGEKGQALLDAFPQERRKYEAGANRFGAKIAEEWGALVLDARARRHAEDPGMATG